MSTADPDEMRTKILADLRDGVYAMLTQRPVVCRLLIQVDIAVRKS